MKKITIVQDLQRKLQESQRDKQELKKSIEELNQCYETKITILENTIEAYENRLEELLEWKKNEIDKQLSYATKFEEQNKKLLAIIDQLYSTFDEEKKKMQQELKSRDEQIARQAQQKQELISKSLESEQKIDQLVKEHTKEIDELKKELLQLKEEIMEGSLQESKDLGSLYKSCETMDRERPIQHRQEPLKEITTNGNRQNEQGNEQSRIKQLIYRSPSSYLSRPISTS